MNQRELSESRNRLKSLVETRDRIAEFVDRVSDFVEVHEFRSGDGVSRIIVEGSVSAIGLAKFAATGLKLRSESRDVAGGGHGLRVWE